LDKSASFWQITSLLDKPPEMAIRSGVSAIFIWQKTESGEMLNVLVLV